MVKTDKHEQPNAARRDHLAQQSKKSKGKDKLKRRLAIKKAEAEDETGELKRRRLEENVVRTIENTREWVGSSKRAPARTKPAPSTGNAAEKSHRGTALLGARKATRRQQHDEEEDEEQQDSDDAGESDSDDGASMLDNSDQGADELADNDGAMAARENDDNAEDSEEEGGDARTRPVRIKSAGQPGIDGSGDGDGQEQELQLDMAGLEDLFAPPQPAYNDDGSPRPLPGPILLTTSPRPHAPTYALLNELQNLLGGKKYAQVLPRKNARFELSKVVKWAKKRNYSAIAVVGEDLKREPGELPLPLSLLCQCPSIARLTRHTPPTATITISLLPHGPTAHFRLSSVQLSKTISNHARPTSHVPELVLSNFSTPLGLSTGRLLQSLFPPMPNFAGRQVVAIHNQRDFIFIRRFRYMFALREGSEAAIKQAKDRGMDEQLRTRMQEIGPRFTLKLRWIKRGTMDVGRRRGASGVTGETQAANAKTTSGDNKGKGKGRASDMDVDLDADAHGQMEDAEAEAALTQQDQEEEESARREMLAQTGQTEETTLHSDASPSTDPITGPATAAAAGMASADGLAPTARSKSSKRKRRTFSPNGTTLKIPSFTAPTTIDKAELPHHRKLKPGASLLDSLAVTVGYGRGGTRKDKKEWEWDPRMQVSRRRFFL